jgi:hypothetical protein
MSGRVINRVDLPENAGSVVLYDWDDMRDGYNLVRLDLEGDILWRAAPPMKGMQDCFIGICWDGKDLIANTWSSYRVSVNLQNGAITVLEFTK